MGWFSIRGGVVRAPDCEILRWNNYHQVPLDKLALSNGTVTTTDDFDGVGICSIDGQVVSG